jgi:hypothetical protein
VDGAHPGRHLEGVLCAGRAEGARGGACCGGTSTRRVDGACAVGDKDRRHRCHERDQRDKWPNQVARFSSHV